MKPKIKAAIKGAALGAAFIAIAMILGSCTTTTTTLPDGTSITTKSTDPAAVELMTLALQEIAAAQIRAEK